MSQHVMQITNRSGHASIHWDPKIPSEVEAARKMFNTLTGERHTAFAVEGEGGKGKKLSTFDPEANEIIIVPPIAGG